MQSADFVCRYLQSIGIHSKLVSVIDANGIDKEVHDYKPTDVIIEAIWVTPEKMMELSTLKRYSKINWYVRLHSKVPFIAVEGIAMDWVVGYHEIEKINDNFYISANSPEIIDDLFKVFGVRKVFMPNVYYPKSYKITHRGHAGSYLNVACFGAIRPLKNHLIQAMAAIEYGEKHGIEIHFHVNADRQEQAGDNVYKNLVALFNGSNGHKLIDHPWMTHENFVKEIVTMDIGLQVSLSEAYNIVAADFVWNEVPFIGSPDIDWLPRPLTVNVNSSHAILKGMECILKSEDTDFYKLGKIGLKTYNKEAKKIWKNLFE
jgi:hypothetical protein